VRSLIRSLIHLLLFIHSFVHSFIHSCKHECTHTYTPINTYIYIFICMYMQNSVQIYITCKHVYTHTHTESHNLIRRVVKWTIEHPVHRSGWETTQKQGPVRSNTSICLTGNCLVIIKLFLKSSVHKRAVVNLTAKERCHSCTLGYLIKEWKKRPWNPMNTSRFLSSDS
jgi:hypothetical protein